MSWKTLVVLLALVAGLAYFALRTEEETEGALAAQDVALFPGLDPNLVTAVRVENVRRDLHMRLERDAKGVWVLTDPVAARAEQMPVDLIVQAAARGRGATVPDEAAADLAKLGLDPPRFVLDVESAEAGGGRRRQRVEIGATELDGQRLFARVDGRVVIVNRELEPLLGMELHEMRASTITDVDPRTVLEVRRTGAVAALGAGPGMDAAFDAVVDGGTWRVTAPVAGLLDPAVMGLFVQGVLHYRWTKIVDEGSRALSAFGLDPPELTLRLGTTTTDVVEVRLGRSGPTRAGAWVGTRIGSPVVWAMPEGDASFFATPLEDLLDHKLLRLRRGSVKQLAIESRLGSVRLERGPKGWSATTARAGSNVFGTPEPAEARVVEDVLGELERYELSGFVRGKAFEPGTEPLHWRVAGDEGETAGTFGAPYTDATGASDVLFQRDGETATAHGDPAIAARLARDPQEFLSLLLLETNEADLSGIAVLGAVAQKRFERDAKGRWIRAGGEVEARELRDVIEALLFVRVSERIPESRRAPLEERVDVELWSMDTVRARIGVGIAAHAGGRRAEVEVDGRRGVLTDARLHEKLGALLATR